mmetsp:Transcript_17734/g.44247  ORF Transcript_17734/g.44247 Transcript_17734/m.44247 type:complete len:97 (+) Transcript_17734:3190-3480(+)
MAEAVLEAPLQNAGRTAKLPDAAEVTDRTVVARENAVTTAFPLCSIQKLAWANMATAKKVLNPRVFPVLNISVETKHSATRLNESYWSLRLKFFYE